ncbi:hypothetical protein EV192_106254 [Actinocrispum wychmicini]|uniref:Uncharacterized protein n=1 Tax=Actinocrispum wychmicini TaxID=1213861 RepID=A0A4R2JJT3_9PSEU|nr:hypothetical protein EV192_106254 [Actinocrispum wychmicini]
MKARTRSTVLRTSALALVTALAACVPAAGVPAQRGHWERYCSADLTACWLELDPWEPTTGTSDTAEPESVR